jgi:AbrB family looped-hinge helix DNA binding protein
VEWNRLIGILTYDIFINKVRTHEPVIDGGAMRTVTISPKFQVVIPKAIREELGLSPGQKVQAIVYGERIELIPIRPIKQMRGFLKGIDTTIDREADRP